MEQLVKLFMERETENYSKYSYINDMIAENDLLDEEIKRVEKEIEVYSKQMQEEKEIKARNLLRYQTDLDKAHDQSGKKGKESEEDHEWKKTLRVLNALKVGIQNIFENIGCSNEHTLELVGTHGVTESNMMQYMGIIEMRTNEIL
mmetsp:Transcript_10776/g.10892  ORF Transcript_10776/g.10892 Transcript_10776/m.10892 type:complete len:146 (+) Transcript_10776:946-1383(+)